MAEVYEEKVKNVLVDRSKINDIVDIIIGLEDTNTSIVVVCITGLSRIFVEWIVSGICPLTKTVKTLKLLDHKSRDKPKQIIENWLNEKYDLTVTKLLVLLHSLDGEISETSFTALMNVLKAESSKLQENSNDFCFSNELFLRIVTKLIERTNENNRTVKYITSYLQYNDVCYYTLRNVKKIINKMTAGMNGNIGGCFPKNIYQLLSLVTIPERKQDLAKLFVLSIENAGENHCVLKHNVMKLSAFKRVFTDAWMSFLGIPLDASLYRHVLVNLEHKVIPYFVDPKVLMDFLVDSYNTGGVTSILALNSLFVLIHKHNLDYPDFYTKLYSLFNVEIFHMKYRARFFQLADLFLMSTHLPAYLVAAFIKRMSRLALRAPPYAIALIIMFVGNLIRRHPNCKVLIHRKLEQNSDGMFNADEKKLGTMIDPFVEDEVDPSQCNALSSSLWELETLRHHYYPEIRGMVELLEKPIGKTETDVSEWFESSYETLFDHECMEITGENAFLEYQPPKGLMLQDFNDLWCIEK